MIDLGQFDVALLFHAQPVLEVVAEVVPEERSHGKRIVHDHFPCVKIKENMKCDTNLCLVLRQHA